MPIRMAAILRLTISSVGEDIKELELSFTIGENAKLWNHSGRHLAVF